MTVNTSTAARIAASAWQLCGVDFHLHGRDPAHGLDCIGLVEYCLHAADIRCTAPNGYAIRGGSIAAFGDFFARLGFAQRDGDQAIASGDIVLARPGLGQWHLMIAVSDDRAGAAGGAKVHGFIHADAGLGKIVFMPGAPRWPLIAAYRFQEA